MKKLMMFAAAMTIVGGAYAQGSCAPDVTPGVGPCDSPVWDFAFKGKSANLITKGYKAVYAISYKGYLRGDVIANTTGGGTSYGVGVNTAEYLVSSNTIAPAGFVAETNGLFFVSEYQSAVQEPAALSPAPTAVGQVVTDSVTNTTTWTVAVTNASGIASLHVREETILIRTIVRTGIQTTITNPTYEDGTCCLNGFTVEIVDKKTKATYTAPDTAVGKLSVFGKGLGKDLKPGQSTSLESDVLFQVVDPTDEESGDPLAEGTVDLIFVGFGKGKLTLTKGGVTGGSACSPGEEVAACDPIYDWPSWSGWFAGWFGDDNGDLYDFTCGGECIAVAGGTWSAKYNKKLSQ